MKIRQVIEEEAKSGIGEGAELAIDSQTLVPVTDGVVIPGQGDCVAGRVLISLRNLSKSYTIGTGETIDVLKNLDLEITTGSFTVIRGESGSGKTSLLRILGMLDSDFAGEHLFAGQDIKAKPDWYMDELRANNLGFIFQDGRLFNHLAIRDNIMIPVRLQGTADQRQSLPNTIVTLAPEFFTALELSNNILSSLPTQVSGGQKQRAAIMRSVINRPAIILADEPTASLDESRKQEILSLLISLRDAGHTVVVVSHDKVFYQSGRQLELSKGSLLEIKQDVDTRKSQLPVREPAPGRSILFGWRPRAPFSILVQQALRETFGRGRRLFLALVLVSLCAGVSQIGVFSSVIVGAKAFLNDAITKGSRLNRLEISPRTKDRGEVERFPVRDQIKAWPGIQAVIARRATLIRVINAHGENSRYSAMGLHNDDPEYRLLDFVAGGLFSASNQELEAIVTAGILPDIFDDTAGLADGTKTFADYIGRNVIVELPQFSPTGEELTARARRIELKIKGVILYAEGGRQIYLPNKTQLVFDRFKMDRSGLVVLPIDPSGATWDEDRSSLGTLANFPWEDQLQVYTKEIRDIIPIFQDLSRLGYKPKSDIWNYKWVLDLHDLAWKIFIPLLALIVLAVSLTVITNLFTSAKMREAEFALWRVLGMRRGDLILTQLMSTLLVISAAVGFGLLIAGLLVHFARDFLAEQNPGGGLEAVFAPVAQFYVTILITSIVVGIGAAIFPAVRTSRVDPAKVLQS